MNTAMHDARSTVADWSRSLSRVSSPFSAPPPDYERHSRLCAICSHPDRDAIEGDFVRWRSLVDIASDYRVPRSTLYRHVHATGLFLRRTSEVRRVMEAFLEEAEHFPASEFDVVTRAVRAYSHLDDDGRWWEPSRMNYILSGPFWPDVPPRGSR